VVACALVAGLFTLLSMVKIWNEAFWKKAAGAAGAPGTAGSAAPEAKPVPGKRLRLVPIAGLAALTLAIGLYPEPLFELARRSARELLGPPVAAEAEAVAVATGETASTSVRVATESGTGRAQR